ncbi:MAG: GGDEF domain-containing protein [Halieaceae bacterium]|nr:GGDEF domain-containing protein [Halieaceae bacterium]
MQENPDIASAQSTVNEILREDRSLYSTQFALGFRSLHFIPDLEKSFRQFYLENNPAQLRRVIPFAIFLTLMFSAADYFRLSHEVFAAVALPRLVQVLALCLLAIPVYMNYTRWLESAVITALILYGASTPIMLGVINQGEYFSPISTQLIILAFCYFLAGLRFFHAALTGAVISIAYPMSQLLFPYPLPNLGFNCFIIVAFNMLGLVGAYFLEYTARENFLSRQLLSEMALFDSLTGLLNRRAFALDLEKVCSQAKREGVHLAVAMADVDRFKDYNDYYGHVQGDQCLRSVATALQGSIRRPLDKAGRYGGEEFILVWYDCSAEDAQRLGEEARQAIEDLQLRQGPTAKQRTITISIGIASSEQSDDFDSSSLIRAADRALYVAKDAGRNQVVLAGEVPTT